MLFRSDDLLSAMNRQNAAIAGTEPCTSLYYTKDNFAEKLKEARRMRSEGRHVELLPAEIK